MVAKRRLDIEIGSEAKGDGFKTTGKDADKLGDKLKKVGKDGKKGFEDVDGEADKLGSKLRTAGKQAGEKFQGGVESGLSGLGDAVSGGFDVGSIADSLSGAIGGLGGTLGPAGAAAGLAIGGALTVGFLEGMEIEQAGDKVAAQLDLTATESERLGGIAGDLYADAYGENIGQVNEALGAVISSVGDLGDFTDKELRKAGAMALDFAAIWDVDVTDAVGDVGILLSNELVKDAEEGFDLMTVGMQKMPAAFRDELIPAVEEYSGFLSGLGFTGAEMFGIMTQAADDFGTFGIDKSMDALKEFSDRATDTSTSTAGAFDTIGLDIGTMQAKLLEGGTVGKEAFEAIVDGILAIEDPVDRANTAVALFGDPIKDLSVQKIPEFLENLSGAEDSLGDFSGAATDAGDTLNDNLATRLESIKRTVLQGLVDFLDTKLIPAFDAVSDWAKENPAAFKGIAIAIGLVALAFGALAIAAGIAALSMLPITLPMLIVAAVIIAVIAVIVLLVIHFDTIKQVAQNVWNWIATNWPLLLAILTGPIGLAVLAIVKNWDTIKGAVGAAFEWIKSKASAGWQWVKDRASDAKTWVTDRWDEVVGFVKGLPGRIRSAASGMWDGIKDSFKSAINSIIGWWNNLSFPRFSHTFDPLGSFGPSMTVDIGGWELPNITPLAEGGIVSARPGGMLALVGEGRHDEAVAPLDGRHSIGGDTIIYNINVNVAGSVRSDRELIDVINDQIDRGNPITVRGRRVA